MNDEWIARQGCGCILYSLGVIVAAGWSWTVNHSILWALLHSSLSWLYVLYRLFFA